MPWPSSNDGYFTQDEHKNDYCCRVVSSKTGRLSKLEAGRLDSIGHVGGKIKLLIAR